MAGSFVADDPLQWLSLVLLPGLALVVATEVVLLQRRHLAEALAGLEVRALTDPLTGLLNRRALQERTRTGVDGYRALFVIDVDRFKAINDTHGHAGGDEVLRTLGAGLLSEARAQDLVIQMGGEEFAILSRISVGEVAGFAERLRAAAAEWMEPWGGTVSMGVVHTADDDGAFPAGDALDALFDRADRCLYQAKHDGRNRVVSAVLA